MSAVVTNSDVGALLVTIEAAEIRWGTEFDDQNTINDWGSYINLYVARAINIENCGDEEVQYDAFIKAAGLALTAAARVITGRVTRRHYDP